MLDFLKSYYYDGKEGSTKVHERSKSMTLLEKKEEYERKEQSRNEFVKANEKDSFYPFPSPEMLNKEGHIYKKTKLKLEEKENEFNKTKLLIHVVRQLSAGADLFRISLPSNLLSPLSMLEYISRLVTPTDDLFKVAQKGLKEKSVKSVSSAENQQSRLLGVMKWLVLNFSNVPAPGICHAKPLNPVLGEIYRCKYHVKFNDVENIVYYFAEQTSHHPPKTSVWMMDAQKKFLLSGTLLPKSKLYPNSAATTFNGEISMKLFEHNEEYKLKLPWIVGYGTIWGSQYIEMNKDLTFTCVPITPSKVKHKKCIGNIHYKTKSKNKLSGHVQIGQKKVLNFNGINSGDITMEDDEFEDDFIIMKNDKAKYESVKRENVELNKMGQNESRRVWHRVVRHLIQRKFDEAGKNKKAIESFQRIKRKKRKKNGTNQKSKFFKMISKEKFKFIYEDEILKSDKKIEDIVPLFKF